MPNTGGPLATEIPNITDWMQGWGSLAAAVTSALAVLFTGWLLRHEIRARREEQADSAGAQARLIVGTVASVDLIP
ncbi:hypothetical protein [Actinoplanes sp. NPDC026623]|uniref:hypothetical protein n=1 Tax=Actinoplanes sp. NPDC026623 TaxID=3155610 RepID=UPI00340733C4